MERTEIQATILLEVERLRAVAKSATNDEDYKRHSYKADALEWAASLFNPTPDPKPRWYR